MTCGLVYANYSLPEWQAVKLTFFAPWLSPYFAWFSWQQNYVCKCAAKQQLLHKRQPYISINTKSLVLT